MKKLLITIILLLSTQTYAGESDDYIRFIQKNGFWALLENDNTTLVFCFGMDKDNKPVCSQVPKRYIVIEVPENLQ